MGALIWQDPEGRSKCMISLARQRVELVKERLGRNKVVLGRGML